MQRFYHKLQSALSFCDWRTPSRGILSQYNEVYLKGTLLAHTGGSWGCKLLGADGKTIGVEKCVTEP